MIASRRKAGHDWLPSHHPLVRQKEIEHGRKPTQISNVHSKRLDLRLVRAIARVGRSNRVGSFRQSQEKYTSLPIQHGRYAQKDSVLTERHRSAR